jgi:hypothetical protein
VLADEFAPARTTPQLTVPVPCPGVDKLNSYLITYSNCRLVLNTLRYRINLRAFAEGLLPNIQCVALIPIPGA